ncbi:MAG: hypothetical protein NZ802_10695, partial [Candidatus Poseidoniales archaeon]|nr:hypothetical protein [Candidatus Poseidoniales archaeon]
MDDAQIYFEELLDRGHARSKAIGYTKEYFPDFSPSRFFPKVVVVSLLSLMMMSTGGYYILKSAEVDELPPENGDDDEIQDDAGDEWGIYYINSQDDLPDCDLDSMHRLYYVENDAGFQTCTSTGWS